MWLIFFFFFSSRRRHTRCGRDWSSDVCSSDLQEQMQDTDFLMAGGELFALVVYAQLLLENARIYGVEADLVDQMFDFLVRDFSEFALQLYGKPSSTAEQMRWCLQMVKKPLYDARRYDAVWTR